MYSEILYETHLFVFYLCVCLELGNYNATMYIRFMAKCYMKHGFIYVLSVMLKHVIYGAN